MNLKNILDKFQRSRVDWAIYWGKPNLVDGPAKSLNLSPERILDLRYSAYISASTREEVIHGNYRRAVEIHNQALEEYRLGMERLQKSNPERR